MKAIYFFIVMLIALTGCSSSKKAFQSSQISQSETEKNESFDSFVSSRIDTTRTSEFELVLTKYEFFNPNSNGKEPTTPPEDSEELQIIPEELLPAPSANDKPPNVGALKSIEQMTIRYKNEDKGESETIEETQYSNEEATKEHEEAVESSEETPVKSPKRWKYIFYLCMLAVVVLLFFKRSAIFKTLKRLFT